MLSDRAPSQSKSKTWPNSH